MAFAESDRVQIRIYLGFSALWLQADPRLEFAITNIQAVVDGGTRPDNTSEVAAKALVTKCQNIDLQIDTLQTHQAATKADEVNIDDARELMRLRSVGRMYVHRLARMFDTLPRSDAFAPWSDTASEYPRLPFGGRSGYGGA